MNTYLREAILPVMLGTPDIGRLRRFAAEYGSPVTVVSTQCGFVTRLSGIVNFRRIPSCEERIALVCLSDVAAENPERVPLLAASDSVGETVISRNRERLEGMYIIWREGLEL